MTKIRALMLDLKSYYPSPAYQLGLLVAYAKLEDSVARNFEFTFTEHPREQPAEQIVERIVASGADLVTASNYAWNYKKICRVLDLLGHANVRMPRILLGGPNSSGEFGERMMRDYPQISAMVEGEGEPAFRDICASMADSPSKDPFAAARNCVTRNPAGGVHRPASLSRIQVLDEIPSPYLTGLLPTNPSPLFYETNRGCPYRCSFCYWGNGNAKIYRMSHDRIREEMEFFASNGVSAFWLADANFGIFPDDVDIAHLMAEVNAKYNYPFRHVGVNWAKNSSDKVLELASIMRAGRIGCTTTLAIQSVTPEAEKASKRYSMAPRKFAHLIGEAETRDIDTYTDIIWGLPGESIEDFKDGLDAVISTGVPAILIHQLYLLPGTEFYDHRERLGLTMLSEFGDVKVAPGESSDYAEYIVVSHPAMTRADMIHGTRLMGVNHILHNHDLGRVVDFYLTRHGISHRQVYQYFDDLLTGVATLPDSAGDGAREFLADVTRHILTFANTVGLDEFAFYRRLDDLIWYQTRDGQVRGFRDGAVLDFMNALYAGLLCQLGIELPDWERELLAELIHYNVLISPKPAWKPLPAYSFRFQVHAIWRAILGAVHQTADVTEQREANWMAYAGGVRGRLRTLLGDAWLLEHRVATDYSIANPWKIPPQKSTADWLLSSRSKHCQPALAG